MICVDSDCIIDFLRGKDYAIKIIGEYKDELITTEVNLFEVWLGIYSKNQISQKEVDNAKNLFDSLTIFSFKSGEGESAAKILSNLMKTGDIINYNDCFIAAIIKKNGVNSIITRNKKHFSKIKDIKVVDY